MHPVAGESVARKDVFAKISGVEEINADACICKHHALTVFFFFFFDFSFLKGIYRVLERVKGKYLAATSWIPCRPHAGA